MALWLSLTRQMRNVNQWLTALQSLAIIAGVVVAIWQLSEISEQNKIFSEQTKIQTQTLKQTQLAASATLVLKLRDKLDSDKYAKLSSVLQNHITRYPLFTHNYGGRGGHFHEVQVEAYIANFEDIGYLVEDGVIIDKMAFDHFSYDIETAWCNNDVQKMIIDDRKGDTSATAISDPNYGHFEKLAKDYLAKDGQTCKDLDSQ
jgi:hypothetical protein